MHKTFVMVPTYNESGNISKLMDQLLSLDTPGHEINILVVDDNSPDLTWKIVEDYSLKTPRVHLLRRTTERGRGTAGIHGFKEALRKGADFVIEMDADFSHDPKYIPEMLKAVNNGADLVLGSRFIDGGADMDRGPVRRLLSLAAGAYIRGVLGLKTKDVTSGYRCFSRSALKSVELDHLVSKGPSILQETLYKVHLSGLKIVEVPIQFIDRQVGTSKLDSSKLLECLRMVLIIRYKQLVGRLFETTPLN
jgi:dolichol-phosphate mannosyltransferase